jgi:2-phospho-L-lactate guanylyltransferase
LDRAARRELNTLFLRHMLDVAIAFPGRYRTAIVSRCDDVLQLTKSTGACAIAQFGSGLNSAVKEGVDRLRDLGAKTVVIIAFYLPLVRPTDIRNVAAAGARKSIVICPDRHRRGTNAMALHVDAVPRFCFGEESYERHRREIARVGMFPITHYNRRIAADIDTSQDFAWWRGVRRA